MRRHRGSRGAFLGVPIITALVVAACPGSPSIAPDKLAESSYEVAGSDPSASHPGREVENTSPGNSNSPEDIVAESMTCEVVVEVAGLPLRGEAMLEKDRGAVSWAAHFLAGTSDRGEVRTTPPFTVGALRAATTSDETLRRRAAAVLLGRCRVDDKTVMHSLSELVTQRLEVESDPTVKVELAMSRALLGDTRGGALGLLETLAKGKPEQRASCAAASYLAQHGKTSGWPALVAAFDASQPPQVRVDAVMATTAFGPLQGHKTPEDQEVDVRGLLVGALKDQELGVRQAAIAALVEIQHPDAIALLVSVESNDPSNGVRAVASHWLWHLRKSAPPTAP